jgi:glycosyltransferase involved in cell wall biosynthesis
MLSASPVDIVMAGTFSAWRLGTLQSRAMPLARSLRAQGIRSAIVTVPWDIRSESRVVDSIGRVELVNTRTPAGPFVPLAIAAQLRNVDAFRPRAIHVFKPKGYGGLTGWMLRRHIPLILDCDDWEGDGGWNNVGGYSLLQRRLFHWQEGALLRVARAVTAASLLLTRRALVLRGGCQDGSVIWLPNGLELTWAERLASGRRDGSSSGNTPITVAIYSRFVEFPSGWLRRFVEALDTTTSTGFDMRVAIVGDATEVVRGVGNVVVDQLGYVARDVVASVLSAAQIAVFPYSDSLITRSKNSVKLIELMAAGCAIVASNVGDVPAIAKGAAIFVDGDSPEAFAGAVLQLASRPSDIRQLSSIGRMRVSQSLTTDVLAERLLHLYRRTGVLGK